MHYNGKVWGHTLPILSTPFVHIEEFHWKGKGHRCSHHRHEHRWNFFYVISGKLEIVVQQKDYDLIDKTVLGPGDSTTVKPGLVHWFVTIEEGHGLEIYYPEPINTKDIVRDNVGGKINKTA